MSERPARFQQSRRAILLGLAGMVALASGCSAAQVATPTAEPRHAEREVPCSDAPAPSSAIPPAPPAEEPAAKAADDTPPEESPPEPPAASAVLGDDGDEGDDGESTATRLGRTAQSSRPAAKPAP